MRVTKSLRITPGRTASLVAFGLLLAALAPPAHAERRPKAAAQPVALTFAFFGCNRIDLKDWEETRAENPSSANIPQLRRNLEDIRTLAPDYLFFGGDLVLGYADDRGETLQAQMAAWIDLVGKMERAPKTHFVAISGNHELNRKAGERKLPNPVTDAVWSRLVKGSGLIPADAKGPTPATSPDDRLATDQRALSFSFDRGPVHFVVLNTDTRVTTIDPATGETKIAMVPTHWLDADLDVAERNRKIRAVIVMGHRNLIDPETVKGDAPIDPEAAEPMIKSLQAHSKVRAYVCAHVHAFDISAIGRTGLRQTTFGNGGSKLEKNWQPARGRTFGFGYFKVYADGSLGVVPYLRPEPKNYLDARPEKTPAATPEPELLIPVR